MKLAEAQEKYPIGSLWRGTNPFGMPPGSFVRRVEGYDIANDSGEVDFLWIGTDDRYPDNPKRDIDEDPYGLHFGHLEERFVRIWLPDEVIDATHELLSLEDELQHL